MAEIIENGIEMEEVITPSQYIDFENPGDCVFGIYLKKEENVGRWNKNRYTLDVNNEEKFVYGTTGLDEKFKEIPLGHAVKIIFKKEIPSKPPNKPFKVFQVFKSKEPVDSPLMNKNSGNNLVSGIDEQGMTFIAEIKKELRENHNIPDPTPEEIVDWAVSNQEAWELSDNDITRIKTQLAKELQGK